MRSTNGCSFVLYASGHVGWVEEILGYTESATYFRKVMQANLLKL